MWMASSDADPDYVYRSSRRKGSNSLNRQKECAKVNCLEFSTQGKIDILRHVEEKTEGEMDLISDRPADAADLRIEANQKFPDRWRRINRNEQAFRVHLARRISSPDLASLPLWLTGGGKLRLNNFVTRAIRFGKTAFAAMMRYAETGITSVGLPRRQAVRIFRAARSIEIEANGILRDQSNHLYSAA